MNPEDITELIKLPQFRSFLVFVGTEVEKLNTLDGLDTYPQAEIAVEVKSRSKAHSIIVAILKPFVIQQTPKSDIKNEYGM